MWSMLERSSSFRRLEEEPPRHHRLKPAVPEQVLAKGQAAGLVSAVQARVADADPPRRSRICRLSVESSRR
jgi:hypothetical protein